MPCSCKRPRTQLVALFAAFSVRIRRPDWPDFRLTPPLVHFVAPARIPQEGALRNRRCLLPKRFLNHSHDSHQTRTLSRRTAPHPTASRLSALSEPPSVPPLSPTLFGEPYWRARVSHLACIGSVPHPGFLLICPFVVFVVTTPHRPPPLSTATDCDTCPTAITLLDY